MMVMVEANTTGRASASASPTATYAGYTMRAAISSPFIFGRTTWRHGSGSRVQ